MVNQFYYTDASNTVQGPCTTLRLMALHKTGELADTSLVCAEGTEDWVELRSIFPSNRIFKSVKTPSPETADDTDPASPPQNSVTAAQKPGPANMATRAQAAFIILILLLGFGLPYLGTMRPVPRWEYKKVVFPGEGSDRIGNGALKYASIKVDEDLLNLLGKEGWEMTGSYLEMETAFPDLGSEDHEPDFQPNVRPQSLVFMFKRPL